MANSTAWNSDAVEYCWPCSSQTTHKLIYIPFHIYSDECDEEEDTVTWQYLQQFLVVEVIAWIKFKDEDVVDTRWPPTIRVDAKQEDKQDDEEETSVHTQSWMPVAATHTETHCRHHSKTNILLCSHTHFDALQPFDRRNGSRNAWNAIFHRRCLSLSHRQAADGWSNLLHWATHLQQTMM